MVHMVSSNSAPYLFLFKIQQRNTVTLQNINIPSTLCVHLNLEYSFYFVYDTKLITRDFLNS
jgi:hypothetical protein